MSSSLLQELREALQERDTALLQSRRGLLLADKVFESTLEGILVTDQNGMICSVNPAFSRITGYSAEEAIGNTPAILNSGKQSREFYQHMWDSIKRDGHWQGEVINRRKNGLLYTEHLSISGIGNEAGEYDRYVAVFSDITQRKQAEERLHYLANHDTLTGLPNRTLFLENLQRALDRADEAKSRFALLFINVDRFKLINDILGHQAGDELLIRIAEELRRQAVPHAMVARLSGDEFILLLENVERVDGVASRAQVVLEEIRQQTELNGEEVFISASIGISLYPDDGQNADTLLANADAALSRAKQRGKNTFQFYTADINARATERLKLELALHRALPQQELELWYQPKIELASGRLYGAEALLRWRHPEQGLVSPARFIPIAEESALMVDIGAWVLATACADTRRWKDADLFRGRMAVNLSGRQLLYGNVVEHVHSILVDSGLPSQYLELEVTESVAMDKEQGMIEVLKELRGLGVDLAIDDFGTGYSSLSYLKRLPVAVLKVDQSFVADLPDDSDSAAITAAIISIAKSLGLKVVAEGVETEAQRQFLARQGCDFAQGYYFSKPLPAAEFEAFLRAQRQVSAPRMAWA
jgi:diguanylate cyclase (GGDEF)-like protein/PAS domain S-box-containing protein